ncbi:MAG: hypothetical protein AAF628_01990 [Planctomycetota bacterium]
MFKEMFQGNYLLDLPVVGMLFFVAVFAVVLGRALCRGAGAYAEVERLPLDDAGPGSSMGEQ